MSDEEKQEETPKWRRFHFESNMFFDSIYKMEDWERLRSSYPQMTDDELLDSAKEATYNGTLGDEARAARPNFGFRIEHDGEKTLRDFFSENKMVLK